MAKKVTETLEQKIARAKAILKQKPKNEFSILAFDLHKEADRMEDEAENIRNLAYKLEEEER